MHEKTQTALPDYLKKHSKAKLSVKAGVGLSVIEDILAGRMCEDHLLRQVYKALNADLSEGVYLTSDLKVGQNAANYATKHKLCIGLTADTGMGKSMIAQLLTKREETFLYTIEECTTPRVFLKGMLLNMRVWFEGSTHAMLHKVAEKLCSLKAPLVVIDESSKLSNRMILCLHDLRNLTERRCGMLLMGMPRFKNNLINGRTAGKLGYSEFFRRINIWEELKGLDTNEIVYILEENGIEDKELQKEYKRLNCIGDLMNKINLYKALND
jgi:hypothetical protein